MGAQQQRTEPDGHERLSLFAGPHSPVVAEVVVPALRPRIPIVKCGDRYYALANGGRYEAASVLICQEGSGAFRGVLFDPQDPRAPQPQRAAATSINGPIRDAETAVEALAETRRPTPDASVLAHGGNSGAPTDEHEEDAAPLPTAAPPKAKGAKKK